MTDLLQRVEREIHERRLLKRGQKILVAVSGGPDSMALLQLLHALAPKHRWKIIVAHFNHRLRGRASDADEKLVRKTAARLKLPVVVEQRGREGIRQKIKTFRRDGRAETASRISRARGVKTKNQNNCAGASRGRPGGTVFSAAAARRGRRRPGGNEMALAVAGRCKTIALVRPLLDFPKANLLAFARENKIRFRDDATNFSTDFLRNRIRNELLPLLRKKYQPGLGKTVLRLMEIVGAESEFVGKVARNVVSGPRLEPVRPQAERYTKLPIAIQRRILQLQMAELGVAADFDLIETLRQSANRPVSVASNLLVSRNAAGAVDLRSRPPMEFNANELVVNLLCRAGKVDFEGGEFRWQFDVQQRSRSRLAVAAGKIGGEFFDADKIGRKIILRHWRPGDRFQPIGLKSAAKLQDLFTNAKIARERRRNLIVAEVAGGEIFWIEGLRISENFKITPQTRRQLRWTWQRNWR